jgi:hypothetical protein
MCAAERGTAMNTHGLDHRAAAEAGKESVWGDGGVGNLGTENIITQVVLYGDLRKKGCPRAF